MAGPVPTIVVRAGAIGCAAARLSTAACAALHRGVRGSELPRRWGPARAAAARPRPRPRPSRLLEPGAHGLAKRATGGGPRLAAATALDGLQEPHEVMPPPDQLAPLFESLVAACKCSPRGAGFEFCQPWRQTHLRFRLPRSTTRTCVSARAADRQRPRRAGGFDGQVRAVCTSRAANAAIGSAVRENLSSNARSPVPLSTRA
jgi:hypothetical protein